MIKGYQKSFGCHIIYQMIFDKFEKQSYRHKTVNNDHIRICHASLVELLWYNL